MKRVKWKDNLPYKIDYDGRVFLKTGFTGVDRKTSQIVHEYRTINDARRIWYFKDGKYYED
jgi:hypothetical protein